MEIYFVWKNRFLLEMSEKIYFDYVQGLTFFDWSWNKVNISEFWISYEKLNDTNYFIKIKDKKLIYSISSYNDLLMDKTELVNLDLLLIDVYSQNIYYDILWKKRFKKIVPMWFDSWFNNMEELNEFSRQIMLNNISTPKVIKPWQYIWI